MSITRTYMGKRKKPEEALAEAVDYCIEHGILEGFLRKNRAEVLGMLLEEFDVKKYERTLRSEGREEGIQLALEILKEANLPREYAQRKLREKYSLSDADAEEKLLRYWK